MLPWLRHLLVNDLVEAKTTSIFRQVKFFDIENVPEFSTMASVGSNTGTPSDLADLLEPALIVQHDFSEHLSHRVQRLLTLVQAIDLLQKSESHTILAVFFRPSCEEFALKFLDQGKP